MILMTRCSGGRKFIYSHACRYPDGCSSRRLLSKRALNFSPIRVFAPFFPTHRPDSFFFPCRILCSTVPCLASWHFANFDGEPNKIRALRSICHLIFQHRVNLSSSFVLYFSIFLRKISSICRILDEKKHSASPQLVANILAPPSSTVPMHR